ncbi:MULTISPECIES: DUF4827 family protein [Parabacteroides]|uniref:DUF4827 family protein n=1 Tax=Parabacteroides leei TaxID=2939491 RepID=UPI001899105C|nr:MULTISPECIES: DUF4827 family protein [Parabacteroides]MCL3852124.1 DUF4827 domain-containing protein [Parabacteroides leei]
MKRGFYILMIMCVALLVASCDKTKSYTERLKDERKAIDRLIDHEGFKILKNYPSDGVFKENEFVKLDNDVYLNVIDSGNGERAVLGKTKVFCRFEANGILDSDTAYLMVDNLSPEFNNRWGFPTEFIFGYNVSAAENRDYDPDLFVGEGLATGLYHVGDGAIVRLIVPFKRMASGGYFQSKYIPVYFSKVRYTFEK